MPGSHTYQQTNHVYPAGLITMAVRAIALLQRISLDMAAGPRKCIHLVCAYACVYVQHGCIIPFNKWTLGPHPL